MQTTQAEALKKWEQYVNLPSGSYDAQDVETFAQTVRTDWEALGMRVVRHPGGALECTIGEGEDELLLLGHMDTVFPHAERWPFRLEGDRAYGPGTMDMKGGLLVMYYALREVLPALPQRAKIVCVLNADEEIGSSNSHALIEAHAAQAFAALSFEPVRPSGAFVAERKGVIAFSVHCTGQRGHAGSAYRACGSAIQQLCRVVNDLYALRDDARDISINVGVLQGGVAENIIADAAEARCEVRFYDPAYQNELLTAIEQICARPGVPGTTTTLHVGASHPPFKANEKSARLLALAQSIGQAQGREVTAESTGGAGDIAYVGASGIAALDGLGVEGFGAHTREEYAIASSLLRNARFAAQLMTSLVQNPNQVR